ncbi:flagellar hook-length control protein FliK [Pseudothauera lacus]|uniref:Flagellar hook-length control protein-like C-terminal domain-containing protein n=1 Tax=Pseudothauera lacus TaxID=2136175 RepID=A0A2T4IHW2_9RHOO|nr:flagellar hook-length control protein FliK [Pseudothauera lacus]PTD97369.1 hypothetical protein C8261_05025 [Pseudothauera lacus]
MTAPLASTVSQSGFQPLNLQALLLNSTPVASAAGNAFSQLLGKRMETRANAEPEPQPVSRQEEAPKQQHSAPSAEQAAASRGERPQAAQATGSNEDAASGEADPAAAAQATPTAAQQGKGEHEAATTARQSAAESTEAAVETAALPAAIAALFADSAAMPVAEEADLLPDLLQGGRSRGLGLQAQPESATTTANPAAGRVISTLGSDGNDNRIASLVTQLQSGNAAAVNTFKEASGRALQGLQGDVNNNGLQGIFAPRGGNPLQTHASTQLQVHTPLGQRGWAEDVGNKVVWLAGRGSGKAELVITPPNLGKVEVSINMNGEQANAHFVAANREAREALEQALPRLRELMQQAGISLGQTSVSDQQQPAAQHDGRHTGGNGSGSGSGNHGNTGDSGGESAPVAQRISEGLVDTFV